MFRILLLPGIVYLLNKPSPFCVEVKGFKLLCIFVVSGIIFPFLPPLMSLLKLVFDRSSEKSYNKTRTLLLSVWLLIVSLLKFPIHLLVTVVSGLIFGLYNLFCLFVNKTHPLLDRVFFVVNELFSLLFFWVNVLVESVCSPFYTILCLILPVIYQTNQSSKQTLPPLAKALILGVYGLGTLLIGGTVLSLLGVIPAMGCMPTALTVASGTLVQLVGQPLAIVLLVLMGLYACAGLAYLMRSALSRGLLIKQAWQLYPDFQKLKTEEQTATLSYPDEIERDGAAGDIIGRTTIPGAYQVTYQKGWLGWFKELLYATFLAKTDFDARLMFYGSIIKTHDKENWEKLLINPNKNDRYTLLEQVFKQKFEYVEPRLPSLNVTYDN